MKQHRPIPPASRCSPEFTEHLRIRNHLLELVIEEMERLGYNQWVLARTLGVSQQRVADLLHRRYHLFNAETLIAMLERFGIEIHVAIAHRRRVNLLRRRLAPRR